MRSIAPSRRGGAFALPKRVNDKADDRNGDAGIGDVEGGPGMGEPNMQIEKKKIDYVPVKKTIGEISQNAGEQKGERHIAPKIRCPPPDQKRQDDESRER